MGGRGSVASGASPTLSKYWDLELVAVLLTELIDDLSSPF